MITSDSQTADLLAGEVGLPVVVFLREDDGEDGVRATARLVHVRRCHRPARHTQSHVARHTSMHVLQLAPYTFCT